MALRTRVRVTENRAGLQQLRRALNPRNSKSVKVGWWGDMHSNGISNAQIASWNEQGHWSRGKYGPAYTPPRPFIRVGWEPKVKEYAGGLGLSIANILNGRQKWEDLFKTLSEDLKESLQETILEWDSPPNSELTEKLKGFNDPLIESGRMYDSVKSEVVKFSKGES